MSTPYSSFPLGATVRGVTFSGEFAGKKMYLLPPAINIPGCWVDSVNWTGTELFYSITAISWTRLFSDAPDFVADPRCHLPQENQGIAFDVYTATVVNQQWQSVYQGFTELHESGLRINGSRLAYVHYGQPPNTGDIYFRSRISNQQWSPPEAFPHNSNCFEDNPELYAAGNKMIFESNRVDVIGTSCVERGERFWYSEKNSSGAWSIPVLVGDSSTDIFNLGLTSLATPSTGLQLIAIQP